MDYKAMGRRIRQQRKYMKMTQETLAAQSEVSASYVGHIERGLKHCSLDTFVCICNALRISPDALLRESIEMRRSDVTEGLSDEETSILTDIAEVFRRYHRGA